MLARVARVRSAHADARRKLEADIESHPLEPQMSGQVSGLLVCCVDGTCVLGVAVPGCACWLGPRGLGAWGASQAMHEQAVTVLGALLCCSCLLFHSCWSSCAWRRWLAAKANMIVSGS